MIDDLEDGPGVVAEKQDVAMKAASDGEARASGEVFNPEGPVGTKDGIWCFT